MSVNPVSPPSSMSILNCPELAALSASELQARIDRLSPSELKEFDVLVASFERDALHAHHALDPLRFALDILPHHFSLAIAPLHREIVRLAFADGAHPSGSESRGVVETSPLPCSTPVPLSSPKIATETSPLSVPS